MGDLPRSMILPGANISRSFCRLLWLALITQAAICGPAGAAETAPAAPPEGGASEADERVERKFQKLMEFDDAVQAEIEEWIQITLTNRIGDATIQQGILRSRIQDRLEPVRKAYEKFIADYPNHARARLAFAGFLRDIGRDQEALAQMEKARELAPNLPAVWNNLGNYYGHNGPATNAFACYEKAIELNPKEGLYYGNLARTIHLFRASAGAYYRLSEAEVIAKAQGLYRKSLELDPGNFITATELAQTYYALKPPPPRPDAPEPPPSQQLADSALAAWEAALKLARDDVEREGVLIHIARWQVESGRLDAARQTLAKIKDSLHQAAKAELEKAVQQAEAGKAKKEVEKAP